MKVAVILGGTSFERDVSLKTGKAVVKACKVNNYDVETLIIDENHKKFLPILKQADIVFNALHGTLGEDGTIQRWLEENNIKFTGSDSIASSLCMNKIECKKILKKNKFLTPKWVEFDEGLELTDVSFPCIVKPNAQGSTFGLSYVEKAKDLIPAIMNSRKFDKSILIEEYISGKEITVGIIQESPMPIVEILPKNKIYDYKCKYTAGMSKYNCPADIKKGLSKKIMSDSVKIFKLLGCEGYGRIDFIIDKNENYYFLEINTLPGMTSTSLLPIAAKAQGLSFNDLVKKIIDLGLNGKNIR
tara:strand:+ start:3680 stop:4582 length:903 start_codon:yes stop_codon:yes gene_type:complete